MKFLVVIAITLSVAALTAADESYTWLSAFNHIVSTPNIFHDEGDLLKDVNVDCVRGRLGIDGPKGNEEVKLGRVVFAFMIEALECFEHRDHYFDSQFTKWLNKFKHDGYEKAVGCFKKALIPIDPAAKVLIGFDPASVHQTEEECQHAMKDVLDEYHDRMTKAKETYGDDNFLVCNRHLKNNPDYYKGMFYKYVILANDNVSEEFLAHKKELFRDDFLQTMDHAKKCFQDKTNEA
jgi:hypothetical protein